MINLSSFRDLLDILTGLYNGITTVMNIPETQF